MGMLLIALRGALGKLGDSNDIRSFGFTRMSVRPWLPYGRRRIKVATDGEIHVLSTPLLFRVAPTSIRLLLPRVDARA
jgi:hypothetical protein